MGPALPAARLPVSHRSSRPSAQLLALLLPDIPLVPVTRGSTSGRPVLVVAIFLRAPARPGGSDRSSAGPAPRGSAVRVLRADHRLRHVQQGLHVPGALRPPASSILHSLIERRVVLPVVHWVPARGPPAPAAGALGEARAAWCMGRRAGASSGFPTTVRALTRARRRYGCRSRISSSSSADRSFCRCGVRASRSSSPTAGCSYVSCARMRGPGQARPQLRERAVRDLVYTQKHSGSRDTPLSTTHKPHRPLQWSANPIESRFCRRARTPVTPRSVRL